MRMKKVKKGTGGWFVKMNAGNPEVNTAAFNHMMDTDGPTSGTTADGAVGSVAVAESYQGKQLEEIMQELINFGCNLRDKEEVYLSLGVDLGYDKETQTALSDKIANIIETVDKYAYLLAPIQQESEEEYDDEAPELFEY